MEQNTEVETRLQNEVGIIDIAGEVTSFSEKILEEAYEKLTPGADSGNGTTRRRCG